MLYSPIHRINDNALMKFIDQQDLEDFYLVKDEVELSLGETHYFFADDVDRIVWDSGNFKHRLNKTYASLPLYTPDVSVPKETLRFIDVHLLAKQGYSWTNVFGWHVIIKSTKSNVVLFSGIITQNDFKVTLNKELIDGSFWLEEAVFKIPDLDDIISTQITEITYDDINNDAGDSIGYIYNYPPNLIPLIDEKPVPDFIKLEANIDDNHYVNCRVSTTENKTVEQSILDYFGLDLSNIQIFYVIDYGNNLIGYQTYRIQNEDNKYSKINFGLNLLPFLGTNDNAIEITVTCEILVGSKLMVRQNSFNIDLDTVNPLIQNQIKHPETIFPVEVKNETVVNNQVIESKENTKVVEIYRPVFVEFIKDDIIFEPKAIYFDKLIDDAYLKVMQSSSVKEQIILSDKTADKIYFDLSKLTPIPEATSYQVIDVKSNNIIGKGQIVLP